VVRNKVNNNIWIRLRIMVHRIVCLCDASPYDTT